MARSAYTETAACTDYPLCLERCLREAKHLDAREIAGRVREGLLAFALPEDDISFVMIKKV